MKGSEKGGRGEGRGGQGGSGRNFLDLEPHDANQNPPTLQNPAPSPGRCAPETHQSHPPDLAKPQTFTWAMRPKDRCGNAHHQLRPPPFAQRHG
eukprot:325166-Chlamydomonas_euryale.AAC.2